MSDKVVDVAVIGAGPAGLTSAMYLARAGMDTVVIEQGMPGGQVSLTDKIENYPGFPGGIHGTELALKLHQQVQALAVAFVTGKVTGINECEDGFCVGLGTSEVNCRSVIIASGSSPRRLGVVGEDEFIGRGISFCATCDGPLYRNKHVAVVGGGDAAAEEALFLARLAAKVTLIHRRDQLRAIKVLSDRVLAESRIEVVWNSVVDRVVGDEQIRSLEVAHKNGSKQSIDVDGLFIYVGSDPNTGFLPDRIKTDQSGYIVTDERMQTSVAGIFASGDVRTTPLRQVATAVGDGAIAATSAERYVTG